MAMAPSRKQRLALVNYLDLEIVQVFDIDTPLIQIPNGPEVKPLPGLVWREYQVYNVALTPTPDDHEIQGEPTYHIEGAGNYVYEKAHFVRVGA